MFLDEFDEALALSDEVLSTEPAFIQAWLQRAFIFGRIGRSGEAEAAIKEIVRRAPNMRLGHVPGLMLINDATTIERYLDGLRTAGLPE